MATGDNRQIIDDATSECQRGRQNAVYCRRVGPLLGFGVPG